MSSVPPTRPVALVVEDEPLILMETLDLLEELGFAVLEATRAARALALLEANPGVTLMVTDVQMPGEMDGFALANLAHQRYPQLSIIVCSGQLRPTEGQIPAAALFIDKPLSSRTLRTGLQGFSLTLS